MASNLLPRKKKNWPRNLGLACASVVALYFGLTSGAFLKAVVLPQVGSALGAELTAETVSLSPFSGLTLRQVKLTPKGEETLATLVEMRVRYSLAAILGGNYRVTEVTVDSPVVNVIVRPDGTGNLAKLLAGLGKPAPAPKSTAPPKVRLDISGVTLKNATLRQTMQLAGGKADTFEVTGLDVTLDRLANNQPGKLVLAAAASLSQGTGDRLRAKASGTVDLSLGENLLPKALHGTVTAEISSATGAFREASGLGAVLALEAGATELQQLRLAFQQSGQDLGQLTFHGPYDLEKAEARISYELAGIDRRVLGLAGALIGVDFGGTKVSASGRVDLAQFGTLLAAHGKLAVASLSLATTNGVTPPLDAEFDYKASFNLTEKTALLEQVDLAVRQDRRDLVRGSLDRPMNIAWDKAQPGFREATYNLTLTGLELAPWRAVAGPALPAGTVDTTVKITAQNDGRKLQFTVNTDLRDVALTVAGVPLAGLSARARVGGTLEDFTALVVEQISLDLRHLGEPLGSWSGLLHAHGKNHELGVQINGEIPLPPALALFPVANVSAQAGTLKLAGQLGNNGGATNVSVELSLANFTGQVGAMPFADYRARLSSAVNLSAGTLTLQRLNLAVQNGLQAGGSMEFSGKLNLVPDRDVTAGFQSGEVQFKSADLNQNALAPFVVAAILPNRLVSVALNLEGRASFNAAGDSKVEAGVKVSNFRVEDPSGRLPTTPLAFALALDAAQQLAVTELKRLQLSLGGTDRAANELFISGHFDRSTNQPSPSSLTVKSDGLDFTTLYNLFAVTAATNAPAPALAKPANPASAETASGEPAPLKLPFQQFDLDVNLARLYLREVAVSNWVAQARLKGSVLTLQPCNLVLNGAPVTALARLDLGLPGYAYDLTLSGERIPLRPLVNSFQPERAGQVGGAVGLKAAVKGAGLTGPSLQKNLNGQVEFAATDLNLKLGDVKSPLLKSIVNVVIGLPDLIRSPGLGTLARLTGLGGGGEKSAGWVDEFSQSPIAAISARAVAGGGRVELQQAQVRSPAFQIDAKGTILLAPVLTNSILDIPVGVALKDSLASKVGLTGTGGTYTPMPDFLTVKGTVGAPKPDIAYARLALLAGKAGLGIAGGAAGALGEKASGLLKAIGGESTNANGAAKPAGGLGGLLNNLGGALGGGTRTNAAPAATNAPKAKFNPLDLFNKPKN